MEADLVARLRAAGLGAATISWVERPKAGVLPAITIQQIAPGRDYSHQGADSLAFPRHHFDIWARTPIEAIAVEAALVAEMEQPKTHGATKFGPAFLNGSADLPPDVIEGGVKVFRRAPDFTFSFEPA